MIDLVIVMLECKIIKKMHMHMYMYMYMYMNMKAQHAKILALSKICGYM